MNWIDAAIVLVFLFFIITAFNAGLIREVIGIAATIVGLVVAGLFYDDIAESLLSSIDNTTTANVIAFLAIFSAITIAGQLLAMLVHPAVVIMQLGVFDQLLGAAFGAVKAIVIIEALLILMITYPRYDMDKRIDDSQFGGMLLDGSSPITQMLPKEFGARVDQFTGGNLAGLNQ
ncbi:MAG TPA: CvpA family protein [Dehalococcoidia bacterium]|jgi:membrane protein required for colicin V production